MPVAAPLTTLQAIQTKVRRLTRSPSTTQLSDLDLQNYINTFVVYDFPEHLRTFNFRQQFTFICNPYQDVYPTDTTSFSPPGVAPTPTAKLNQLFDFQNKYLTVHEPVYIGGYQSFYTQSRQQFFGVYPMVNSIAQVATGDGVTQTFTGVVTNSNGAILAPGQTQQTVLLQNNVLFSSVDINNEGLALIDVPILDLASGNPTTIGNLVLPTQQTISVGTINYITGQFTLTFPIPPRAGQAINSQTVPQIVSIPQALLFYQNQFVLRPVPDQPYRINFEVYVAPTYLMDINESPALNEYWQYIAFSAAKKILEDRMDFDSVALLMPSLKEQERLVLRRTIVQNTNERTATIYTEQTNFNAGYNGWGFGGGNF